jgi:hypothetical protein
MALLTPLGQHARESRKTAQFDLGFSGAGTWWYTLLDAERIAVLEDPRYNAQNARLRIGKVNGIATPVQSIPDAIALGDAWHNGLTLAVLASPDRLFVLNRETEELEERRDLRRLAEAAIRHNPGMACFYFSGSVIITVDSMRSRLWLHSSTGEVLEIDNMGTLNPGVHTAYTRSNHLSHLLPGIDALLGINGFSSFERAARRAGRRAPLTSASSMVGNIILPCGPNRFVLVDDVYHRLVVIEHSAKEEGIRNAGITVRSEPGLSWR